MSRAVTAFTEEHGITLTILTGPERRREHQGREWAHDFYTVLLRYNGSTMRQSWFQGTGITTPPTVAAVLESLLMDARSVNQADSFEDWCSEYGYDTDSRKAEAMYKECQTINSRLREMMGDTLVEEAEELDFDD